MLWAYITTVKNATGEMSYSLAFGFEKVIPVKIGVPSFRVKHFDESKNKELIRSSLDLLNKKREQVLIKMAAYQ